MSRKLNRWIDGQEDRWMKQLKTLTLGPSPSNDYTEIEYTNYLPSYSEKIGSQEQWPNQEGNRHHLEDCLEGRECQLRIYSICFSGYRTLYLFTLTGLDEEEFGFVSQIRALQACEVRRDVPNGNESPI